MKENNLRKINRTFAIGDIHGYWQHLEKLLEFINYNPKNDRLIFLGDYIDRGEDPKKTLDLLMQLLRENPLNIALMGNHEHLMLSIISEDGQLSKSMWLSNGCDATLKAFGLSLYGTFEKLEKKYVDFLYYLKQIHIDEENKIIYAHAGVDPTKDPHKQDLFDEYRGPMWIRMDFYNNLEPANGYKVIFGHTPTFNIKTGLYNVFWDKHKIGIDTGLCYGFKLTALQILSSETFKAYQIDREFETFVENQPE